MNHTLWITNGDKGGSKTSYSLIDNPMKPSALKESNLISILRDDEKRDHLVRSINAERGWNPPLNNRYEKVAATCIASADDLRQVIGILLRAPRRNDWLIDCLIFHPQMPVDVLHRLYADKRGRFDTALAHVSGPQEFLEMMAHTRPVHSEARSTLLYNYYATASLEDYRAFIERHVEHWHDVEIEWNFQRAEAPLSAERQQIALEIIGKTRTLDA